MRKILIIIFAWAICASGFAAEPAPKLTKAEYEKESSRLLRELVEHPGEAVKEAKDLIAGTFEVARDSPLLKVLDQDATFTVNTMLFTLAVRNGIKKDKAYIENYRLQVRALLEFVSDKDELYFLGAVTAQLIWENDHLPGSR